MKKRIVGILFAFVFTLIFFNVITFASSGNERTWCFMNDEFNTLQNGILTEPYTCNGLTLSNGLEVVPCKGKVKSLYFLKAIYTKANGSKNDKYIKISVNGSTDIHILGKSNSNVEDRYITVYSAANNTTNNIKMTYESDDYVYKYRGPASDIYLYTSGGSVRIYSITAKDYVASEYAQLADGAKKVWDFDTYTDFPIPSTGKSDMNFNGLKVKATQENFVDYGTTVGAKDPYGYGKGKYINLDGTIKIDGRYITFPVNKNSDVYITAQSSAKNTVRNLFVWNKYYGTPNTNNENGYIAVDGYIETYKLSYYGDGEDFMIGSQDSGIKIYKISVVPRVNKVVDYKNWDISNNSNFAVGAYTNNTIDGLTISNSKVVNVSDAGYKKAIHIRSKLYATGNKIKFDISDSSKTSGAAIKRTINIKAKTTLNGVMLILRDSNDFVIGVKELTTNVAEYKFEYTGNYDSIYVYSYYPGNTNGDGAYIYSIDNGYAGSIGPEDIEKTISVVKGKSYKYFLTGSNIFDVSAIKYTITYNENAIGSFKIGESPVSSDYSNNLYYDSNIKNISNVNGVLTFEINNSSKNWSGILCPIEFTAKSTGNTTIKIKAEKKA